MQVDSPSQCREDSMRNRAMGRRVRVMLLGRRADAGLDSAFN